VHLLRGVRGNWVITLIIVFGIVAAVTSRNFYFGCLVVAMTAMGAGLNVDNALVLAPILRRFPPAVRWTFATLGVAVSVAGVQLYLPTLIVALLAHIPASESLHIAITDSDRFSYLLETLANQFIEAGAGGFLLLAGIVNLLNPEKTAHWLGFERILVRFAQAWKLAGVAIGVSIMFSLAAFGHTTNRSLLSLVCFGSVTAFLLFSAAGDVMSKQAIRTDAKPMRWHHVAGWLVIALILEMIFSIDGLAGAFALTSNMKAIAIGMTLSGMLMRALALHLSESNIVEQFHHLEQALPLAVTFLGGSMCLNAFGVHVPDILVGTGSTGIILASIFHSHVKNKRHGEHVPEPAI